MGSVRRVDEQFLDDLDAILSWAAERGIKRRTRFHIYRNNIEWLRAYDKEEDQTRIYAQLSSAGKLTEILSTMAESIEFVETIPILRQNDVDVPQELLQRVFSGPADTFQENSTTNHARNAMFELSMGAMAAREGLKPVFSNGNPDVSFQFVGRTVKMECKRVLSENKIVTRLREGIRQLDDSVQKGTPDIGFVAISLSRIINPGDRLLISDKPNDALSELITTTLRANEQTLGAMLQPSVSGFLFYLSSVAYIPGRGYSPIRAGTVFPLNFDELPFLKELAGALRV